MWSERPAELTALILLQVLLRMSLTLLAMPLLAHFTFQMLRERVTEQCRALKVWQATPAQKRLPVATHPQPLQPLVLLMAFRPTTTPAQGLSLHKTSSRKPLGLPGTVPCRPMLPPLLVPSLPSHRLCCIRSCQSCRMHRRVGS